MPQFIVPLGLCRKASERQIPCNPHEHDNQKETAERSTERPQEHRQIFLSGPRRPRLRRGRPSKPPGARHRRAEGGPNLGKQNIWRNGGKKTRKRVRMQNRKNHRKRNARDASEKYGKLCQLGVLWKNKHETLHERFPFWSKAPTCQRSRDPPDARRSPARKGPAALKTSAQTAAWVLKWAHCCRPQTPNATETKETESAE